MAVPPVSVVICAYTEERWEQLVDAARSAQAQIPAPLECIVVVDHNPVLLERVRREIPRVVAIANDGPRGLSGARNSGSSAARGDVVAFLDDDAAAEPGWLAALLAPYADQDVIAVGGSIEPVWPEGRPRMLPPEFDWVVGCTYRGMPHERAVVRNLIGANMSLRRSVLEEVGGFRNDMGRVGRRPLGCEETELCIRASQRRPGTKIVFEPSARVRHHVSADRATWRYFRSRCYAEGLSKAVVVCRRGASKGLAAERAHALRTLPRGVVRELRAAAADRDPAGALRAATIVAGLAVTTVGYALGSTRRRSRWSTVGVTPPAVSSG